MAACVHCNKKLHQGASKYCSRTCVNKNRQEKIVTDWLEGRHPGIRGINTFTFSRPVREWLLNRANNQCEKCGWDTPHPISGETPLEVHHKDGNYFNTTPENCVVLCPNCHSLTETYRARNKGKGRVRQAK